MLCSEDVWLEVAEHLDGREIDMIRVKGKQSVVRIYEVVGETGWLAEHPTQRACFSAYAEGLEAYRAQRFSDAMVAFERALAADASDGPSATMRARAATALKQPQPRPELWSGVYNLTSK